MFNLHFLVHYQVIEYVKPNAGLKELLNSAKEETSQLTKKDTVIVLGGTNYIERNLHGKSLTSTVTQSNSFKHAKLIKATTNRELFTQHGLHLNIKGKEIISNEITGKLLTNVDSQKVNVIHLPWKIESAKQLANGQSDSTTQINKRAVTSRMLK